jgi:hypothetical protein
MGNDKLLSSRESRIIFEKVSSAKNVIALDAQI